MLNENEIIKSAEEYMDENCIIFNKASYKTFLKVMLDNPEFVNKISDLSSYNKLLYIEEIENALGLDLSNIIDALNKAIKEEDSISKINELSSMVNALRKKFEENRSADGFTKIKDDLLTHEYRLRDLYSDSLNESAKALYSDVFNTIEKFKGDLDSILDTFMTDERYADVIDKLFMQNRIWTTRFGNYQFNPYFNKTKEKTDYDLEFKPLANCARLKSSSHLMGRDKYFAPLAIMDELFISKDGRSITSMTGPGEEKYTINLDDDILGSGTILYLKNAKYIVVCCKNAVKFVTESGVSWSYEYKYPVLDSYELKSVSSFNNTVYINFTNKDTDTSLVYVIRYDFYQHKFSVRPPVILEDRIMGNLSIMYDDYEESTKVCYISKKGFFVSSDAVSLDIVRRFPVDGVPFDTSMTQQTPNGLVGLDYYYPVSQSDGKLYYNGLDKNDHFCLYIVNPQDETTKKIVLEDIYVKAKWDGSILPSFTNTVIGNDEAVCDGTFKGKMTTVSLDGRMNSSSSLNAFPRKANTMIVRFKDNIICLEENVPQSESKHSKMKIVSVWQGKIVTAIDTQEGYQLFTEI